MKNRLARDYVWECDYGERTPLMNNLMILLDEQDAKTLGMAAIFVNNNMYNLEFFLVLSYEAADESDIKRMKELLEPIGIKYRPDITFDALIKEQANRRFNSTTLLDSITIEDSFASVFIFKERNRIYDQNTSMSPMGKESTVFISHTSCNKKEIRELIPFLNSTNLPVWYDEISIDFGDSISQKIQEGIRDSGAVIFWVTEDFLKSNWCKLEMDSFLMRYASNRDVRIITVIHSDVDEKQLPVFIKNLKYLKVHNNETLESVAKKIIPTLVNHLKKNGLT